MNNEELKNLKKQVSTILDLSSSQKQEYDELLACDEYDISEVNGAITDTSTIQDLKNVLKSIRRTTGIQRKIRNEADKNRCLISDEYAKFGDIQISNGGNYYVVTSDICKNSSERYGNSNRPTTICSIYDKLGNLLLPFSIEQKEISYLDDSNFVVIPQDSTKKAIHYRITNNEIQRIFECDYKDGKRYSFNKSMSFWAEKGLAIIVNCNREHLYSFIEGRVLSYGFSSIESVEDSDWDKTDFTKEYDCCRVTLDLSSDLPFDEGTQNPNISTTLVGYIDSNGELINSMINLVDGKIYLAGAGKESTLERVVSEDLNKMAKLNVETQELLATNKNVMMKKLIERKQK